MSWLDRLQSALSALLANLLRSVLTMLGIIIGAGAVIVTVGVGAGAEARVEAIIRSLGSNLVFVVPGTSTTRGASLGRGTALTLTDADARAIAEEVPGVLHAGAVLQGTAQVVYQGENWSTAVVGTTPGAVHAREWRVAEGRLFSAQEARAAAKVALLGQTVARRLFGDASPVGASVRIRRVPFEVIGLLAEKGETPLGRDQDDTVFMPITTARKRVLGPRGPGGRGVSSIVIKGESPHALPAVVAAVTELLRQRHRIAPGAQDDFTVRNVAELLARRQESSRIMSALLAAVASISLLVGGIGIMNIMLVSVTERTREIGIRMAVGASRSDVLWQFLIEAMTLSLVGGVLGIALGYLGAGAIAGLADWPMRITPAAAVIAFAFSAGVGVFFGLYPARKASLLNPIEALRHE